jgi:hypothetical protein
MHNVGPPQRSSFVGFEEVSALFAAKKYKVEPMGSKNAIRPAVKLSVSAIVAL